MDDVAGKAQTELIEAVRELREQVAQLAERISTLETTATAAAVAPAAPVPVVPAPAPAPELSEELVLVISAAIAAYLGKKPYIRQIRLISSSTWSQQGRVSVQIDLGHTATHRRRLRCGHVGYSVSYLLRGFRLGAEQIDAQQDQPTQASGQRPAADQQRALLALTHAPRQTAAG